MLKGKFKHAVAASMYVHIGSMHLIGVFIGRWVKYYPNIQVMLV